MTKSYLLLFSFIAFISCSTSTPEDKSTASSFSYKIIHNSDFTLGYDIYEAGKLVIHQPHIPAVSGVKGFKTEADAINLAKLIVYKLEHNIMPPTVSLKEIDSLKVNIQ